MDNKINLMHDLTEDLTNIIIGFLTQFNFEYYIQDNDLDVKEVFSKDGLLILFIYDKEKLINEYIEKLNENRSKDNQYAIEISFIRNDESLLDVNIEILNNIKSLYNVQDYRNFLLFLAEIVLTMPLFKIEKYQKNIITFDALYSDFYNDMIKEKIKLKGKVEQSTPISQEQV